MGYILLATTPPARQLLQAILSHLAESLNYYNRVLPTQLSPIFLLETTDTASDPAASEVVHLVLPSPDAVHYEAVDSVAASLHVVLHLLLHLHLPSLVHPVGLRGVGHIYRHRTQYLDIRAY